MKTKFLVRTVQLLPVFLFWSSLMFAQQLKLGDNPSAQQKSALLELESKSQGLLLPRISDTTSGAIATAPDGMIIYLTLNNSLCIRSNGHWRPLLPEGYAITSMNGQTIAIQSLATTNTAGALGFTSAAGTHTLNIPDATSTNSGFVNTTAQTMAGAKTFTNTLTANQDVFLTGINIDNTKDSVLLIDGGKLLKKQLTGLPPIGTAGGDLTGTYPNPSIAAGAVTGAKIAQAGATTGQALKWNGTTWAPAADDNNGLTSVGLSLPLYTFSNSPLTANGTLTGSLSSQTANTIFAAPNGSAGAPAFRALVAGDIPSLPFSKITGTVPIAQGGTGLTAVGAAGTILTSNGTSLTYAAPSVTLGGDVTGTSSSNTIAAGAVTGTKIAQAGATSGQVLKWNGTTWAPAADDNSGSISSIGLVVPSFLTVSPATLTANGTFTIGTSTQSPNLVFAGPSTGSTAAVPTFRSLVAADMTIGTQRLIGRYSNGTGVGQEVAMDKTLKMLTGGYLYVDTTLAVYNAQKIQSVNVSTTAPTTGQVLKYDGTNWSPAADNNNGLTSVGLTLPSMFTLTGSPLTANGTIAATLASQTAGTVFAAPTGGGTPTFRTLVAGDIPSLPFSQITGTVPVSQGGTGLTTVGTSGQVLTSNGTSITWATPGASASGLTSVGLSLPTIFNVTNSPLTANGTLTASLNNQTANTVFAGPSTGGAAAPTFRALGINDIQNVNTQKLLGRYAATSGAAQEVTLDNTLKLTTAGTLYADSALAVWNAAKVQGVKVSAATPTSGQVLKYNSTTGIWEPNTDNDGGATYGKATTQDISYATADGSTTVMKIWQSNVLGTVVNGPKYTNAYAWSTMAFNGTNYTTQLYFDKNTLAIKEWGGVTAPLTTNAGNGWYKAILTNGDNKIGVNAIVYGKRTYDASAEAASDSANFVYVEGTKRLGIGTSSPAYNLDVTGTERVTGATTLNSTLAVSGNTTMNGTVQVGSAGTALNSIVKVSYNTTGNLTVSGSGASATITVNNSVVTATSTSSIFVNPSDVLGSGVSIAYAYWNGTNIIIVLTNSSGTNRTISSGTTFIITVIN